MLIYLVTNHVNGKRYVGKTSKTLEERWKVHCQHSRAESAKEKQYITRAIAKHGSENFVLSILETVETNDEASILERFWIAKLNLRNPSIGYNLTDGGEGTPGRIVSEETREKLRNRKVSDKTRKRISEAQVKAHQSPTQKMLDARKEHSKKMTGENNPYFGKSWGRTGPLSVETKQRLSQAHMGKILLEEHKQKIRNSLHVLRKEGKYIGPNLGTCFPILAYHNDIVINAYRNFDDVSNATGVCVKIIRKKVKSSMLIDNIKYVKSQRMTFGEFVKLKESLGADNT